MLSFSCCSTVLFTDQEQSVGRGPELNPFEGQIRFLNFFDILLPPDLIEI
jgi:hypothetical protein